MQVRLRLSSATWVSLRAWALLVCTKAVEDANPGTLEQVNQLIKEALKNYKTGITVALQLMEIHFPRSSLSLNSPATICKDVREMTVWVLLFQSLI